MNDFEQQQIDMISEIQNCSKKLEENKIQDKLESERKAKLKDYYVSFNEKVSIKY